MLEDAMYRLGGLAIIAAVVLSFAVPVVFEWIEDLMMALLAVAMSAVLLLGIGLLLFGKDTGRNLGRGKWK